MDILRFLSSHQNKWWNKPATGLATTGVSLVTPRSILVNAVSCGLVISELCRGEKPEISIVMGGVQNPLHTASRLGSSHVFLIGGNRLEQLQLAQLFRGASYESILLDSPQSTLEEVKAALDFAASRGVNKLGVLTTELFWIRATCTFVKQVRERGLDLTVIPLPCLDLAGQESLQRYFCLAGLIEAWKLWRYQRRGHVAKRDELIEYVQLVRARQGVPV